MRWWSWSAAIGLLLSCLFVAPSAMAEPPLELGWNAPPGCPQQREVRDQIQKLLGSKPQQGHLRADGTIVRSAGRFRLELVIHVGDLVGTRTIEADSCKDLAGAAAVALGLLIPGEEQPVPEPQAAEPKAPAPAGNSDPTRAGSEPSTPEKPAVAVPTPSPALVGTTARTDTVAPSGETRSRRPWRVLLQVPTVALEVGPLPQPSLGLALSGGVEFANVQLQLQALVWQRQNVSSLDSLGYGADIDRIGAALWACRAFRFSWFGLSPCLTLGAVRVSASGAGRNVAVNTAHALGMSTGGGVQSRLYLASWIRVVAAVAGQVQLSRPHLSIDGVGSVYQFSPLTLTAALGVEWIL